MKAIINVSKFNQYSKFNGRTFKVIEIGSMFICLDINGVRTDFSFTEVILVNIDEIYKKYSHYIDRASEPKAYILKTYINSYMNKNNIIL